MPLVNAVWYYRRKSKFKRHELAEIIGVALTTLGNWEYGSRPVTFQYALKMSSIFDVSSSQLVGYKKINITTTEYHNLRRPNSIYIPNEIKVHDKYKKLIDAFLYTKRPARNYI